MIKSKIIILFLLPVLITINFTEINAQSLIGVWSGSIHMQQNVVGQTGHSETKVTITIIDNRAIGTVQQEGELIMSGKVLCKGSCGGSGAAELHEVIIDLQNKTYSIHAISPKYTCNNTGSNCDAAIAEMHEIDVSTYDRPLGNSPNVLVGSETTVRDVLGMATQTTTVTWNLVRSIDVELIVTPEDYDNWLPEPGGDEVTKGTVMNISLKLQRGNGQTPTLKAKAFELRLSNSSKEPGITLNAPLNPQYSLPDLRFLIQSNAQISDEFQFIRINCNNCLTGDVSIGSYDGGGWSTLTATAILEDDTRIEGNLLVSGGIQEIPIPKRNPGSKIATAWLIANGDPGEMDDKETSGGNTNDGDGLTAYEEYRGVISQGRFRRLDPNEKELGVYVKRGELPLFSEGLDWFENATNIKIIRFFENEIGQDRRLNKNFSSAHAYDQYVLKLEKKHVRRNVFGRTAPGPGIPKAVTRVMIDYDQIVIMQQKTEREARRRNVQLPYTLKEVLAKTVAHELGHGVNVPHHGNDELTYIDKAIQKNDPVRIYFPYGRSEETTRPYPLAGLVGKTGNQGSGDIFCIMNYNPSYDWSLKENNNTFIFYMVPLLPAGNLMCNSKVGTDINATPDYFGDATVGGNCLSHIKLK